MRRGWNNGRRGDESFEEMIEALYELRAKCARLAQRVRELLEEIGCDSPGDQAREDGDRRERGGGYLLNIFIILLLSNLW